MYRFNYCRAASSAEAAERLEADEDARLLAGGMSLIPILRLRMGSVSTLVDLNRIEGLRKIERNGTGLRIGAMATHQSVANSALVRETIPALAQLASKIGDPLVRNRGTIGGSLAHNDPAACYPCALLGLGGSVETNRRMIDADAFIHSAFQTALVPGEMIVAVHFPRPELCAHFKFANKASRLNIVGVFVSRREDRVRVGITGAGHHAFRIADFEHALETEFAPRALADIIVAPHDLASDIHAAAPFRAHLVKALTMRAVAAARTNWPDVA